MVRKLFFIILIICVHLSCEKKQLTSTHIKTSSQGQPQGKLTATTSKPEIATAPAVNLSAGQNILSFFIARDMPYCSNQIDYESKISFLHYFQKQNTPIIYLGEKPAQLDAKWFHGLSAPQWQKMKSSPTINTPYFHNLKLTNTAQKKPIPPYELINFSGTRGAVFYLLGKSHLHWTTPSHLEHYYLREPVDHLLDFIPKAKKEGAKIILVMLGDSDYQSLNKLLTFIPIGSVSGLFLFPQLLNLNLANNNQIPIYPLPQDCHQINYYQLVFDLELQDLNPHLSSYAVIPGNETSTFQGNIIPKSKDLKWSTPPTLPLVDSRNLYTKWQIDFSVDAVATPKGVTNLFKWPVQGEIIQIDISNFNMLSSQIDILSDWSQKISQTNLVSPQGAAYREKKLVKILYLYPDQTHLSLSATEGAGSISTLSYPIKNLGIIFDPLYEKQ